MSYFTGILQSRVLFSTVSHAAPGVCRRAAACLLAAFCMLTAGQALAASFARGEYTPVGVAFSGGEQPPLGRLLVLGGSRAGVWYRHTDLPIVVQGVTVTPENAMDFENGEDAPCETPLVVPGQTVALYAQAGKLHEAAVGKTLFFTHPVSGELFIAEEFTESIQPGRGLVVGVNGDWNAMPVGTNRTEDADSITFSIGGTDGMRAFSVVLTRSRTEDGEIFFKGEAVTDCKISDVGSFYTGDAQAVSGFFIDLDGDAVMEFVVHVQGVAGSTTVFAFAPGGEAREVMNLDFGD